MSSLAAVPPVAVDESEDETDVETGVKTDDLADSTEVEEEEEVEAKPKPPMQEALPGDWGIGATEFGGRAPDTSEIRLLGGKMPIEGSFAKGTILDLHVRVKVTGVLGQDTVDAWGTEQHTTRRHMAHMLSVKRV